ncbi:MAG: DNA mismatch repair endonuclease MutL [Candidatus Binatia bacterium]|nr:DNA mismatch repair endonuclease MutL [Candidatus Binatia bacterium]
MTSAAQAPTPKRIELLDPLVADQIAAGEVIERPASVVKELVENALDAGATDIRVELEAGGRDRIRVQDDGFGMSPENAERACLRHATSKLSTIDQLTGIATLGFRGEALASIASVARVEIRTRERGSDVGTRLVVESGAVREAEPAGVPEGTSIEVTELFATVPARRKFLRKAQTEQGHIVEWLQRIALARPDVGFQCVHGTRQLLRHPAVRRPEERLRQVLGADRARDMVPVSWDEDGISVRGFASRPGTSFAQARHVLPFVGGRHVRDRLLLRAILDAYRALLPQGRYPSAVLFLEVPGEMVDVNVHPTKTEVRFADSDAVFGVTLRAVRAALAGPGLRAAEAVEGTGGVESDGATTPTTAPGRVSEALQRYVIRSDAGGGGNAGSARERFSPRISPAHREPVRSTAPIRPRESGSLLPVVESTPRADGAPPEPFAALRVLGQALNGYVVCAYGEGLVLIDQHAAHERVRFERLRAAAPEEAASQRLLVPAVVELGSVERVRLIDAKADLARAGFEVEEFGDKALIVRAIPAALDVTTDARELLEQLAADLAEVGVSDRLASARDALLARVACHGAVRVGDPLSAEEMKKLVAELDTIPFASTCPHGRPLLIQLDRNEIERRVGRT